MTLLDSFGKHKIIIGFFTILVFGFIFVSLFNKQPKTNTNVAINKSKCSPNRIYFSNGTSLDKSQLIGWEDVRDDDGNHVTFTKDSHSLSIVLDPFKDKDFWWDHGGICFFPDTPGYKNKQTYGEVVGAFEIPKYTKLTLDDGSVIHHGKVSFSTQPKVNDSEIVCYKSTTSSQFDNSLIGYITINYPTNIPDPRLLAQIDNILSSIQKHSDALCAAE